MHRLSIKLSTKGFSQEVHIVTSYVHVAHPTQLRHIEDSSTVMLAGQEAKQVSLYSFG